MEDTFYKDGLCFECQQCSNCCRKEPGYVYISNDDLTKLLDWFNLKKDIFIQKYCRWVPYYDGTEVLCLNEKPNYDCIFWENGGCSVYGARPLQCSTFPFWGFIVKNEQAWKDAGKDCPGIGKGEKHFATEIEEKVWLTRKNEPIKKEEF